MNNPNTLLLERARQWTLEPFDDDTRKAVSTMIEQGGDDLTDAFYKSLEFGTGGMRGLMGPGTNRMNKYTIGMSTQGLANYLIEVFGTGNAKVAIAYDCRNNSAFFAQVCADVLSGNGFEVLLFESLRPTPELSFAIRHYGCTAGIMVTASHNPKEYNGYKVYWNDGAQLVSPHDLRVVEEAAQITNINDVIWKGDASRVKFLGYETDKIYTQRVKTLSMLDAEIMKQYADLPMVYTPLHGTGTTIVPMAMQAFGFTNVLSVPQQSITDGNFPTVISPNPEEGEALKMGVALAEANNADLVMATDPDADRVGIAVRDDDGKFVLLNGNETAVIIIYYLLEQWKKQGKLDGNQYIVKTIVSSYLLDEIAASFGVECFNVLTGFKYIAEVMRNLEGKKTYIAGGEESYGLLIGDFVRDKDAVSACCIIAEAAVYARSKNMTLIQMLKHIHAQHGVWREHLVSVTRKGKRGAEEIGEMMEKVRNSPPQSMAGIAVREIRDFMTGIITELENGSTRETGLASSNVLQLLLEDGSLVTMRPSGTEPKIKFYFSVRQQKRPAGESWSMVNKSLVDRIGELVQALDALMG
jgi:phosphoglucomutase